MYTILGHDVSTSAIVLLIVSYIVMAVLAIVLIPAFTVRPPNFTLPGIKNKSLEVQAKLIELRGKVRQSGDFRLLAV